ncbi:MAG TPA: hypothetical protein PLQ76_05405, partial [bacterium]|nr:hypothetical protein [bacterium]
MAYNRERAERITALSVPVLLAAACYLNTLQNGFVYDDRFIVVNSPIITDLSLAGVFRIFGYISPNHYLPVRYLSYAVDYSLWGLNPFGFHFTNVVLHCVNALLVTLLTARLAGVTGGGRRSWIIAGIAGALFAVHPINTETVAWVTGRKDLLATAFTLSAIITYLKSYDEKRRFKTDWYLPASVLLFVSAVLSKASVIAFPLVLVALEIFVRPGAKHRVKHSAALRLAPFFIVDFIITFMDMKLSVDSGLIKAYMGGTPLFHYMTICKIPLLYLGKLLYPVRLSVEYSAVPERSVFSLMFVASLIFWAAVAVWFWAKRRTGGFAIFFTAWAILNLGPFMNVLPTSKLIADRYAYLPAIGVFALAGWCAARYAAGRGVAAKVVIVLLLVPITVLLGCRTISRNRDWNNEFSLWKASYALEPKNGIVLHNLGFAYYEKG